MWGRGMGGSKGVYEGVRLLLACNGNVGGWVAILVRFKHKVMKHAPIPLPPPPPHTQCLGRGAGCTPCGPRGCCSAPQPTQQAQQEQQAPTVPPSRVRTPQPRAPPLHAAAATAAAHPVARSRVQHTPPDSSPLRRPSPA